MTTAFAAAGSGDADGFGSAGGGVGVYVKFDRFAGVEDAKVAVVDVFLVKTDNYNYSELTSSDACTLT